jgi:hypothetical protein
VRYWATSTGKSLSERIFPVIPEKHFNILPDETTIDPFRELERSRVTRFIQSVATIMPIFPAS